MLGRERTCSIQCQKHRQKKNSPPTSSNPASNAQDIRLYENVSSDATVSLRT